MAKNKAVIEEPPVAPETPVTPEAPAVNENPEPAVTNETPEAAAPDEGGMDIQDTALAGIEGKLVAVNHATGLNLRKSPHYMADIAEVLPDGAVLVELELPYGAMVEGWALVHTGQRTGWVDRRFILDLEG